MPINSTLHKAQPEVLSSLSTVACHAKNSELTVVYVLCEPVSSMIIIELQYLKNELFTLYEITHSNIFQCLIELY